MERVTIEGNLSSADFDLLRRSIAAHQGLELQLGGDYQEEQRFTEGDLDLIAALAGVIQVFIGLWTLHLAGRDRSEWSKERAEHLVGEELMRRGVVHFTIEKVENYEALFAESSGPCVFTVRDNAREMRYWVLVFRSGNTATIRLR